MARSARWSRKCNLPLSAAIRSDTESVAIEIDDVEQKFGEVDEQIDRFKKAIGEFVNSIAA